MGYYQRPNGTWRVDAWWDGRVVWSATWPTEDEARWAWIDAMSDLRATKHPSDRYRQDRATGPTVESWMREWHPKRRISAEASRNQWGMIVAYVFPHIGPVPLVGEGALAQPDVQQWVWKIADELMPRTQRHVLGIVQAALTDAVLDPAVPLAASPVVKVRCERPDPTGREALTVEQVAALVKHAPKGYAHVVLGLAFTGVRAREMVKRDRHDMTLRKTVEVKGRPVAPRPAAAGERQNRRGKKKAAATKSPAGARSVVLCDSHAKELSASLARHASDALWVDASGRRLTYYRVRDVVARAAVAARKARCDVPADVTPHWLRHTHRTWLEEALVPDTALNAQLGHSSKGMAKVYGHVTEPMRQMVRDALEVRWVEVHRHLEVAVAEAQ